MTDIYEYARRPCRFSTVCHAKCDESIPVTECPNYWKMDDIFDDKSYRNDDDDFYNDGDFEEDEW